MNHLNHYLYNGDCLKVIKSLPKFDTIFADPPDNIGLKYATYKDQQAEADYVWQLRMWLTTFLHRAGTVWFSFNSRWTAEVGGIVGEIKSGFGSAIEFKPCVQTFTFGQHNHKDLGNNHRPLWRLRWTKAPLFPDAIRVPSWRQENGDKRADPRGRVPGDVFDFPRVTGNSKQRRAWHPTQLHEGLVERCLLLTTPPGGTVCDPFGGTGTTLRACKRIERSCTLIELDPGYCDKIAAEHGMAPAMVLDIEMAA